MTGSSFYRLAQELDAIDPIREARNEFAIPISESGEEIIYLCGNSLGLMPRRGRAYVEEELHAWESLAVDAHFDSSRPWMSYHENLAGLLADIVGGSPTEVVAMNSLTVNLHLMLTSFYRPTETRYKVVIEADLFPSDRYAIESHLLTRGIEPSTAIIELEPNSAHAYDLDETIEVLDRNRDNIALLLLGGVNYYNGQLFDMETISREAKSRGIVVGFDLAHAAGNVPLALHDWNVDFAVWCGYKYLNGGPGCIAGCFVHERHATDTGIPRLGGWWGHRKDNRFKMPRTFEPSPSADGWQLSNPPIFAMAPLLASCEIFSRYGMRALREKSISLTTLLHNMLAERGAGKLVDITPARLDERGCQFSLRCPNGKRVFGRLLSSGVVCDWREPDIIRLAPVPLYNSHVDVATFGQRLLDSIDD